MWDILNSFMKTMRKLFISRSSAEISPMLWYEHGLWVSFGAEFEKRCQGHKHMCTGGPGWSWTYKLNASILWCCSKPFPSQLQVPCKHQRPVETRVVGSCTASKGRCWGARACSPCQTCSTPGTAKESQSSFVFWSMPSWTVDLELRRSAKLCFFENPYWSCKVRDWSILSFTDH